MTTIGTAIIGPGKVGHTHAVALAGLPQSRFVAVCGRNPEQTAAFAAQYGVRPFTDIDALLNDPDVEMVSICTPAYPRHGRTSDCSSRGGANMCWLRNLWRTASKTETG